MPGLGLEKLQQWNSLSAFYGTGTTTMMTMMMMMLDDDDAFSGNSETGTTATMLMLYNDQAYSCPRDWRLLTHLCPPLRSTFAVRETASLGIMGALRVPP